MNKLTADELRKEIVEALNNPAWVATMNREKVIAFLKSRGWTVEDIMKHNEEQQ